MSAHSSAATPPRSTSLPNVEDVYPLSPIQEGMLLHGLLERSSNAYVQQLHARVTGPLDVGALERAFQCVVDRHPMLRTAFVWEGLERPLQVVRERAAVPVHRLDWSGLELAEQERALAELLTRDRSRGFVPSRAPLLRTHVVRTGPTSHELVWTLHHLVIDGWSTPRVLAETFEAYEALRRGEPAPERPAAGFRSYIDWLGRRDPVPAEAFFRELLSGVAERTPFWSRRGRPGDETMREPFAEERVDVARSVSAALEHFLRAEHITLGTLLTGAWALVLGRHEDRDQVVVGCTVSGRGAPIPDIEQIVGVFINSLPVPIDLDPRRPVGAWLRELQATLARIRDFEWFPLPRIRDTVRIPKDLPLFENVVVVDTYPMEMAAAALPSGLRVERIRFLSPNDLPLTLKSEPGDGVGATLKYDRRRVPGPVVHELGRQLAATLENLVEDGERPLGRIRLAAPQLGSAGPVAVPARTTQRELLHRRFASWAERRSEDDAVVAADGSLRYAELFERARGVTARLAALGAGPDTLVALHADRSIHFVVGMLGILGAGAAYVPLDPAMPAAAIGARISEAGLSLVLTTSARAGALEGCDAALVYIDHCEPDPGATWGAARADDLAYGIFTSGSTGRPKLVLVGHRQLAGYLKAIEAVLRPRRGDGYASVSTPAADLGHTMIFPALATGGTLHLASEEEVLEPECLARRFHAAQIDHLKITPTHLAALLAEGDARLLPRRSLVVGGEPFPWTLWEAIRRLRPTCAVFNHYGPTETTVGVLCQPVVDDRDRSVCANVPVGGALAHADVRVLDAGGRPAPAFAVGEIVVSGPCVARGYLDRPEVDGGAFGTDPDSGARRYATGDRARSLPDGRIEFLGRRDEQVKVRGHRVELGELRAALLEDARVGDAAVIAQVEDGAGTRLLAYVQLAAGAATDGSALRAELRERVPEALVPSSLVVLDRLPRTPNGKLDLAALRGAEAPAPAAEGSPESSPRDAQAQEDDVTARVMAIWCELFGLESVGADADFHELGGHSLLALRLTSRLRRGFDVGISVKDVFAAPTIAEQARTIQALLDGPTSAREESRTLEGRDEDAGADARQLAADLPEREHLFGLSPAQHAMLRAALDPRQALLNTSQRSVELWGALQPALLELALARVVGHHEALRTCFRWDARDAVQVVLPTASPEILVADWRSFRPAEQAARMDEHVRRERQRGFDLREAPLLRLALFRVDEERHWLGWFVHHIVSDRWSFEVLLEDLLASYDAIARGATEPGPAFPPFRRYVEWLSARDVGAADRYWRNRLRDFDTPTLGHLPRPIAVQGTEPAIAAAETVLGPIHARALEARARELRVTLGTLVHAAWARALQRFTGLEDVLFGTVVAGRPVDLEGVETTVGLFLNVLPVRVRVVPDAAPTDAWLRALHEDLLTSLEFDFLSPYDMQAMTAVRGAAPAVESVLVHQGQSLGNLGARPGPLRTGRIWTPSGETPAPLLVEVEPEPDLHVRLAWHTDRFEERHAFGLLDAMEETLADLAEPAPDARVPGSGTRRDALRRRTRHDT